MTFQQAAKIGLAETPANGSGRLGRVARAIRAIHRTGNGLWRLTEQADAKQLESK